MGGDVVVPKKMDKKEQFSDIETIIFVLSPDKTYQHRIEQYSGKSDQIIFDEQFLLDDNDDPEKVMQEMKKKQQRLMQMDQEEKKLSENIKKAEQKVTTTPSENEESEAFRKIRDYLK